MEGYILNVFMSAAPYLVFAAILFLISFFIPRAQPTTPEEPDSKSNLTVIKRSMRKLSFACMVGGLIYAAIAPTNTPKNTLDVDIKKQNQIITEQIRSRESGEITDKTAKPKMTDEERKAHFEKQIDRSILAE